MDTYIVYKLTNTVNQNAYIGITKTGLKKRWWYHKRDARNGSPWWLHQAIRKHGEDVWEKEILYTTNDIDDVREKERFFIKEHSTYESGYNMNEGGTGYTKVPEHEIERRRRAAKEWHKKAKQGLTEKSGQYGRRHSEETKQKMSNARKGQSNWWCIGREVSEETREKLRKSSTGRKHSKETREKITANKPSMKGGNNPMYGKKHSEETKQKIRKKALERIGRKQSEDTKRKIGKKKSVSVEQISLDGLVIAKFCSMREASKTTGACQSAISVACSKGTTAGGFLWRKSK